MQLCILFLLILLTAVGLCDSVQIPCQAQLESKLQYRNIFWYKVVGSDSLSGLVMKDLRRNTTVLYASADLSYQIGEDLSLLLPEIREEHCEIYRCSVWPPLGYRIQESDYSFPQGCKVPNNKRPEFSYQWIKSSVYFYVLAGVITLLGCLAAVLLLLGGFALLYQQKPKYTKVPV